MSIFAAVMLALTPTSPEVRVTPVGFVASQPQVAVFGTRAYVVCGHKDLVYVIPSRDGGRSFGAPMALPAKGRLSLGMRRGPRIAVSGRSVVVSAVYGGVGDGRDGELLAWRSEDAGKTWLGPSPVSDSPGSAREGLHAMAASDRGLLACAWLDLRDNGTQIWLSTSRDAGVTWTKNVRVYRSPSGTVCECCHPSVAFGTKGEIYVMFRNWLDGSRDMYLTRSVDDGRSFEAARKLGKGTWKLNACPMDGGALAVDGDGTVRTAWRRAGKVFACTPGQPELELGDGTQPWITSDGSGDRVVWQAQAGALRSRDATVSTAGRFPAIASSRELSLSVWERGSSVWARRTP